MTSTPAKPKVDHRTRNAAKKRTQMRMRILMATMHVYADESRENPVIEDVVHEAAISRGTFYKYFNSLDEALLAVGQETSEQFALDLLPIYDVLKEPWQRFAVGFRIFLVRACLEPRWAAFVSRMDVWPRQSLVARKMVQDLQQGKDQGVFTFGDVEAAADFLKGASVGCLQAVRRGVADPRVYIDTAVGMGLAALGCQPELCARGVLFSARYLEDWRPRTSWLDAAA